MVNSLKSEHIGCHFVGNISKCIFFNDRISSLIQISLKLVSESAIHKQPLLAQVKGQKVTEYPDLCVIAAR